MNCPKCKKLLKQISGLWTPKTPDKTYRKYICNSCKLVYTEVVDVPSHKVINVNVTPLNVSRERQSSLMEWLK